MIGRFAMALALVGSAGFALADECEFRAQRSLNLDAAGVLELQLIARAGDLRVVGDSGSTRIEIEGIACASSAALLEQIQLSESLSSARRRVEVQMPETSGGWWSKYARMDLEVRLPARMQLSVDDSSGDLDIESVAALKLNDSSGDIRVRGIGGEVRIEDSSGDIDAREIAGDIVVVEDSSGDIRIEDVQGSARVEVDSSGSISLREINRDAFVGKDSSGEIVMERINGNAEVGSDGSGSIRARDVRGDFRVGSDTSGGVSHSAIGGQVSVPAS